MNLIKYTFLITSFLFFLIKNSFACEIKARVSVVGNEFPAIQTVGAGVLLETNFQLYKQLVQVQKNVRVLKLKQT